MCLHICIYIDTLYILFSVYIILNFTSSWDFGIFKEYWISRSRCNIWCSLCAQGSHEKTSVSWFASVCTDQPSINGKGPINRSEKNIHIYDTYMYMCMYSLTWLGWFAVYIQPLAIKHGVMENPLATLDVPIQTSIYHRIFHCQTMATHRL